jgi:hypothetical protein
MTPVVTSSLLGMLCLPVKRPGNMMLLWLVLAGLMPARPASAQDGSPRGFEDQVRRLVRRELRQYPESTLLDLYKGFFQSVYGPGHLIPDRQRAADYMQRELSGMRCVDTVGWQPLGLERQYYRVNLCLVADGILPGDALLDVFIESANRARSPEVEVWRKEWNRIADVIGAMEEAPAGAAADRAAIDRMLGDGRYIGHHSEAYEAAYHPHYRIVERSLFLELRRKYLDKLPEQWPE